MRYFYTAATPAGIKKGEIEAKTRFEARAKIKEMGYELITLEEKRGIFVRLKAVFEGVSVLDKVLFAKHLSVMLKSGMTLNESLATLRDQAGARSFKKVIDGVLKSVLSGRTLADSLARHENIFSSLFVNIVRAGEEGGTLDENLSYLADYLRRDYDLRNKMKSAAAYPLIVVITTFVLGGALSVFVLPKLADMFRSMQFTLPLATRILIWISNFLQGFWWLLVIFVFGLIFLIRFLLKRKTTRPLLSKIVLGAPIIGKIAKDMNLARATRTFGSLLRSGIPIVSALYIVSSTIENSLYSESLKRSSAEVQKGATVSSVFAKNQKLFPPLVTRMIGVGERTGRLDEMLTYLANFYEGEVDTATKNLSAIVEPILLILIGLVVGFVAIAIISPIYEFTGAFGGKIK